MRMESRKNLCAAPPAAWFPLTAMLVIFVIATCWAFPATATAQAGAAPAAAAAPADAGFVLEKAGFHTPESVLYDPEGDVYLVANINGAPGEADDNGFISRVSPDGKLLALRWLDAGAPGVTLNAPKGMGIRGDSLYVADINAVRIFSRRTGAPLGAVEVPGAKFLNDVAVANDGSVYVSDTGTQTIHRIGIDGQPAVFAQGTAIGQPNGLATVDDIVWMARMDAGLIARFTTSPEVAPEKRLLGEISVPAAGLDGLVRLDDGTLLVSSWGASSVYRIDPTGKVTTLFDGLNAPADVGYDGKRGRLLIPFFRNDKIEARPLAPPAR